MIGSKMRGKVVLLPLVKENFLIWHLVPIILFVCMRVCVCVCVHVCMHSPYSSLCMHSPHSCVCV